jgi:hypothetical protein
MRLLFVLAYPSPARVGGNEHELLGRWPSTSLVRGRASGIAVPSAQSPSRRSARPRARRCHRPSTWRSQCPDQVRAHGADRALRLAIHDVHVQFLPDKIECNDVLTGVAVQDLDLAESYEGGRYRFDGPSSWTTVALRLHRAGDPAHVVLNSVARPGSCRRLTHPLSRRRPVPRRRSARASRASS